MSTINNASVISVRNEYKVINKQGKDAKLSVEQLLANPLKVVKAYCKTTQGRNYYKSLGYNPTKVHLSDFAGFMRAGHFVRPVSKVSTAERLYKQGRLHVSVDALGCVDGWYELLPNRVSSFAWVLKQIENSRKAQAIADSRKAQAEAKKVMPTNRKLSFVVWLKYQDNQLPASQLTEMYDTYTKSYTKAN